MKNVSNVETLMVLPAQIFCGNLSSSEIGKTEGLLKTTPIDIKRGVQFGIKVDVHWWEVRHLLPADDIVLVNNT